MNPQKELSAQVLEHNNQTVAKYKQKKQILEVKKQKLAKLEGLLPNSFVDILTEANRAKNQQLVVNSIDDPNTYHTAEKLTNLYWLRAISDKKGTVSFQETRIGKKIMKDIRPKSYTANNDYTELGILLCIIEGLIGTFVGGLMGSYSIMAFIIGLIAIALILPTISFFTYLDSKKDKDKKSRNRYLTPLNCIKSSKNLLNPKDIKYEFRLLKQYSVKEDDDL